MKAIMISQAKPNPVGKDRLGSYVPSSQLAGEWVDVKNIGDEAYSLGNLDLQHVAYNSLYPNGIWEKVTDFTGNLLARQIARVHSGGKILLSQLNQIDRDGADYHVFTGKNYVWNNDKSDTPRIVIKNTSTVIDKATYSAYPTEGKILKRVMGDRLI